VTPNDAPVMELRVPALAEYVSVVRLAVLGLCGRLPLSYNEVEDLRLAVGEACASSVQRAAKADCPSCRITVTGELDEGCIVLTIRDDVPLPPETGPAGSLDIDPDFDDESFRISLMQLLVDEVGIGEGADGGQVVRLVKKCEQGRDAAG
jgi:serine/threonine-protein kinase RsbW